jgi:hypothetical protein
MTCGCRKGTVERKKVSRQSDREGIEIKVQCYKRRRKSELSLVAVF